MITTTTKIILAGLLIFLVLAASPKSAAAAAVGQTQGPISLELANDAPKDPYGHLERNLDGSYYRGDRIQVNYAVKGSFGLAKDDAAHLEIGVNSDAYEIIGQPKDAIILGAKPNAAFGLHNATVTVSAVSEHRGVIARTSTTFQFDLVPFQPSYNVYRYPVLKDAARYTIDDRTGVIIDYKGSIENNTVYPNRRMILEQSYDSNSTGLGLVYGQTPIPLRVPVPDEKGSIEVPTIDFVNQSHIMKVETDTGVPLYFNSSGLQHYYLKTSALNQTALDMALNATIVTTYSWPAQNYTFTQDYTIPAHREPQTNSLKVEVLNDKNYNGSAFSFQMASRDLKPNVESRFMSLQDYALAKTLFDTNNIKVAAIVRDDMPSSALPLDAKGNKFDKVVKNDILLTLPLFSISSATNSTSLGDYLQQDWNAILTGSQSPMILTATNGTDFYQKVYEDYDFAAAVNVEKIDVRHTSDLKVYQNFGHLMSTIEAPWEIKRIEFEPKGNLTSSGCQQNRCNIDTGRELMTGNHTIIAFNEYGGSSSGILLAETKDRIADSQFFGVTSKIANNQEFVFWIGIATFFLFMVFFGKWMFRRFANRVNI